MESLALLCTLHADGPATLKRLRRAGCDSLESIGAYGAADLATLLEVPPAVARRLLKEARGLSFRLDEGALDDAEEAPQVCTGQGGVSGSMAAPEATTQSFLDQRDYAILGRVLDRWSPEKRPGDVGVVVSNPAAAEESVDVAPEAVLETKPKVGPEIETESETTRLWPEDPGHASAPAQGEDHWEEDTPTCEAALCVGDFEGLNEAMIATLAGADIGSLSDLVDADPLALVQRLRVTYANARRMQFLARAARTVTPSSGRDETSALESDPSSAPAERMKATSSSVSLSFGVRAGQSRSSYTDSIPMSLRPPRKFWEPRSSVVLAESEPASEELAVEPRAPEDSSTEVPGTEAEASKEPVGGGRANAESASESAFEPTDGPAPETGEDAGPKALPPADPPKPEAATYGTPWPQESGAAPSRPLHVRFPSEPSPEEAPQVEEESPEARSHDRPLNWNFDLMGPSVRFPGSPLAAGKAHPGSVAFPGQEGPPPDPVRDPVRDGVGGPFA
jgi:hypothetical protein